MSWQQILAVQKLNMGLLMKTEKLNIMVVLLQMPIKVKYI